MQQYVFTVLLKWHLFFSSVFVRGKCLFFLFYLDFVRRSLFFLPLTFFPPLPFFSAAHLCFCRAYEPALGQIWQRFRPVRKNSRIIVTNLLVRNFWRWVWDSVGTVRVSWCWVRLTETRLLMKTWVLMISFHAVQAMLLPHLIVSSKPNVKVWRLALYLHYDSFEMECVVSVIVVLYWYARLLSLNKVCSQNVKD